MAMKYNALRLIANINKIFGYVILLVGIISIFPALNIYFTRYYNGGFLELIFIPVGILCLGLFFVAAGEIIYLLIDIESNTLQGTESLVNLLKLMKSENQAVKFSESTNRNKIQAPDADAISEENKIKDNGDLINIKTKKSIQTTEEAIRYLEAQGYNINQEKYKESISSQFQNKYILTKNGQGQTKYSDQELINYVNAIY